MASSKKKTKKKGSEKRQRAPRERGEQRRRPAAAAHGARPFWSGTISFGLVSVPVHLFPGNRSLHAGLRMLSPGGSPVSRRYFSPETERDVDADEIVRGFEVEDGQYVVVEDEELEALQPRKSRDIDLSRFVDRAAVPPLLFERSYYLTPSGDSNKAYRLLAEVMESSGRAGIATFVMRGKEYLVAILAERGILRAETLRFSDEIRGPEVVGLPPMEEEPDTEVVESFVAAIEELAAEELPKDAMTDEYVELLRGLAGKKLARGEGVVEYDGAGAGAAVEDGEEDGEGMPGAEDGDGADLFETIRRSLAGRNVVRRQRSEHHRGADGRRRQAPGKPDLSAASKQELYERAQELDIGNRSKMTKAELIRALRRQ